MDSGGTDAAGVVSTLDGDFSVVICCGSIVTGVGSF